jgi:antitoxin (DNA-binding transcriptional repressor) of toxin-antitoxin stability system
MTLRLDTGAPKEQHAMILTLAEAQAQLPDLIHRLAPGEEVAITENNRTVAKLTVPFPDPPRPLAGRGKGTLIIHAEDDEHLEDTI